MPPKTKEQKERAKALHKQKLEEKRLAKEKAAKEAEEKAKKLSSNDDADAVKAGDNNGRNKSDSECDPAGDAGGSSILPNSPLDGEPTLIGIPLDSMSNIMSYLPAKNLGALISTCRTINAVLSETKSYHLFTRLNNPQLGLRLCQNSSEAETIIASSLNEEGEGTKRLITKKSKGKLTMPGRKAMIGSDEYPAYARFIEESVTGHTVMSFGGTTPIILPRCVNGRIASCSPEHTLCRAFGGHIAGGGSGVVTWGVGNRGQLGHGKRSDSSTPFPLMGGIGYKIRIVQVAAGGGLVRVAHSLLLTDLGRVLSFGTGQYGQLGHGWQSGRQLPDEVRPRFIEALARHRVTCVAAGELHSACITEDGDLYTWGDGFCGQLGHADKRPQLLPKQVVLNGMEDECAMVVSCGARHTLVNTEDGEVFSFGLGHFGALGRQFTPYQNHAEDAFADLENIAEVAAAEAAAADAFRQVHAQGGQGDDGDGDAAVLLPPVEAEGMSDETRAQLNLLANLTLDDDSDQLIPVKLDVLEGVNIIAVSAGHRHSLVLDDKGKLYSFGAGLAGCLGHGDLEKQEYPVMIRSFPDNNIQISQFSAGVDMSMAVSTDGTVYAWGKTKDGRIGLSTNDTDVTRPRAVCIEGNKKAVDVECGYVHSVIVAVDGTVQMCGGVGVNGEVDGQQGETISHGLPTQVKDLNVWHRVAEPKEETSTERWQKYGKYELKGRSKVMTEKEKWGA